ncbi:hypothetical protein KY329_03070 [Candidatus Woesearchaeota archaeon]|nr:hypothetical protein [Candidatus Woesearchaeota archaeon]
MPRRRKQNFFQKFFTFIGKAIVWIIVNLVKTIYYIIYYIFKGIFVGIGALFRKSGKSKKKERPLKKESNTSKKEKGTKAEPKYQALTEVKTESGSLTDFEKRLNDESLIVAIAGKRGSGKSALGFKLLENIHAKTNRPCFALGPKQSSIPRWIHTIDNLDEVENNGIVLVDEGAISFGSRSSMTKKNKELSNLLAIARHKDLTLIFITQNTGMIDKNVLNLCDTIILKEGSLLQEKMERSVMKDMYRTANKALKQVPDRKANCYIFDSDFEGLIKVSLPSFWSSKVSKNQA